MKAGEFPDGARTLRAKIDMASPNIWMRDPVLYRIRHAEHHHTGEQMVHLSDVRFRALPERLHRRHHALHLHAGVRGAPPALRLDSGKPRPAAPAAASIRIRPPEPQLHRDEQAQAAAAGATKTSSPAGTIRACRPSAGLRRRGVTPEALRNFAYNIGITKYNGLTDVAVLEHAIREDLNKRALRVWPCCARSKSSSPIIPKAKSRNWTPSTIPKTRTPARARFRSRRELYIERDDFMEIPPPKYFRLQPGGEVRLQIRLHHQVR